MKSIIVATTLATVAAVSEQGLESFQRKGLSSDSALGRHILSQARRLDGGNNNDMSWVSNFSIKFLGCHTVTQWIKENADDNDDGNAGANAALDPTNEKLESFGLVRLRLCPTSECFDHFSVGCSKHYGEYVVSMSTFLEAYVQYEKEISQTACETYRQTCYNKCNGSSQSSCYSSCFKGYGVNSAFCSSYDANGNFYEGMFDMESALQCAQYDYGSDDGSTLYVGAMCSGQGGKITLGLFSDDSCIAVADNQPSYYEKNFGAPSMPHTSDSIVSTNCMSCSGSNEEAANAENYYNYDADGNKNYYSATNVNSLCASSYLASGKCETEIEYTYVAYPEEGACTFMEGVKRLKSDGIIRGNETVSSKPAKIAICFFTGCAALLLGYVVFLKHRIQKTRVNLAGVTTSLA